jgi:hypothetical protein
MINISKKCSKCGDEKEISEFSKNKRNNDGLQSICKQCSKLFHLQNKDKINQYHKKHYSKNTEAHKNRMRLWKENNREDFKAYMKDYYSKNKQQNPHVYKWRDLLWDSMKRLGNKKESSTHHLLLYSALDLKNHLDSLGMNWDNDNVDHKIPVTWFKSDTPPYVVNDLRNLQPLSENDNKSKGNLYMHPVSKEYFELVKEWILEKYQNSLVI